jgi:hypothetical protein
MAEDRSVMFQGNLERKKREKFVFSEKLKSSTFLRAVNDEQVNEVKKSVQQHQQQQQQQQQYQQPQQHQIQQQQQHQQQNLMLKKLSAPVVAMDDNADTVGAIEEFDQDNDTETSEMNVPLLFAAEPVKKFVAPAKPAPAPPSKVGCFVSEKNMFFFLKKKCLFETKGCPSCRSYSGNSVSRRL